jgi:hypothetical protein
VVRLRLLRVVVVLPVVIVDKAFTVVASDERAAGVNVTGTVATCVVENMPVVLVACMVAVVCADTPGEIPVATGVAMTVVATVGVVAVAETFNIVKAVLECG